MRMRTGRQDLVAFDSDTDGTWNPMTEDSSSTGYGTVRFRAWVAGLSGVQIAPGYQFSKDGVDWDSPHIVGSLSTPTNDTWNFIAWGDKDLYDGMDGVTEQLFVRFGLFAKPTNMGQLRPFQGELEVEADPFPSGSLTTPWALVYGESSSTPMEFPLTAALPIGERAAQVRVSVEVESAEAESSDTFNVQACTFEGNKPMDPSDWAKGDTVGSFVTSTTYGTSFTAITPAKRYLKFGVQVKSSSGNLVAGRVRLRVDYKA